MKKIIYVLFLGMIYGASCSDLSKTKAGKAGISARAEEFKDGLAKMSLEDLWKTRSRIMCEVKKAKETNLRVFLAKNKEFEDVCECIKKKMEEQEKRRKQEREEMLKNKKKPFPRYNTLEELVAALKEEGQFFESKPLFSN